MRSPLGAYSLRFSASPAAYIQIAIDEVVDDFDVIFDLKCSRVRSRKYFEIAVTPSLSMIESA